MVLLDFGTGLRRGELAGLKWEDINFEEKVLTPARSVVAQRVGNVKTQASEKPIPLDDVLIEELLEGRSETPYTADSDYVFASWKDAGQAAVVDEPSDAAPHQAFCCESQRSTERLAHSSSQLHDVASTEREQPQACPGPVETCVVQHHSEHL
jgi:hypothetical protein